MTGKGLADLDELVLQCQDPQAKAYIAEAVGCYTSGAYRSCVVATWIAVVFDFVSKLRQLELIGDANAKRKLDHFEDIRRRGDISASLAFERGVPDMAYKEFELLSRLEYEDLQRLLEDRNRCAHPSMNSSDEAYQPTAETARYHIRNAVAHLLQHPPVQGKAAMNRLLAEVSSEYFPTDADEAAKHFSCGPLERPRESLVRNLIMVLAKTLLFGDLEDASERKHAAALNAVRKIQVSVSDKILQESLSELIRKLDDENLEKAVRFVWFIQDSWQYLETDVQGRVERYVEEVPEDDLGRVLEPALEVAPLRSRIVNRIASASESDLVSAIQSGARPELADHAVELYTASYTFDQANRRGNQLIVPLAGVLSPDCVERIVEAAATNDQIAKSFDLHDVLWRVKQASIVSEKRFGELLTQHGLHSKFPGLMPRAEAPDDDEQSIES